MKKDKMLQKAGKQRNNNADIGNGLKEDSTALYEQYKVIRDDLIKLKDDVTKGYGMARGMLDKKTLMKDLLKAK